MSTSTVIPRTRPEWTAALQSLPSTPDNIPAFFFAHGSPMLAFPKDASGMFGSVMADQGPKGALATFLKDFGPTLLKKYSPKGIVVFSAHWETGGERLGLFYPLPKACIVV
jgi:aromatic ring-opening dioxygenase catalytic subunit (LigB family)